jgi:hypothetical protein
VAKHLLDEERVAVGLAPDGLGDLGRRSRTDPGLDEARDVVRGEPAARDPLAEAIPPQLREPAPRADERARDRSSGLGAVHPNAPSRSAIKPSTETLIE